MLPPFHQRLTHFQQRFHIVLPLRKKLPVSPSLSVGIRVPEHLFMRQISRELSMPIVSTSANISGGKEAAEASDLDPRVSEAADLIIDGGRCQYAQGSTVIDLIQMKVVRAGAIRKGDRFEFG